MEGKQALRQMAYSARRDLRAPDLSAAVAHLLTGRVAAYAGLPGEPFVPPRPGWLLPVLLPDGDLDWAEHDGALVAGPRGTAEPAGPRLGVDAIAACDVVLVPALLVARDGTRLGKGGGSYDRALARATGLTVALVHDHELVDALPAQPHDVRVRAVATPAYGVLHLP